MWAGRPSVLGISGEGAVVPGARHRSCRARPIVQRGGPAPGCAFQEGPGGSGLQLLSRAEGKAGRAHLHPPALPCHRGTFSQGYLCKKCGVGRTRSVS